MVHWGWLLAEAALFTLATVVVGWLWNRDVHRLEDEQDSFLETLLQEGRGEQQPGVRYEIVLSDWGDSEGEMRWRWTVWDADRALRQAITERRGFPEDESGVLRPYMLGNAGDRWLAISQAMAWCNQQGASAVVTGVVDRSG